MPRKVAFSPDIDAYISEAESAYPDLPAGMLRAQLWQESGGNPNAVSPKSARGIAQVLDDTARNPAGGLGVDIPPLRDSSNPRESINFMARAMDALIKKHGDTDTALTVYNAGPGRAGVPFNKLPAETRGYIRSINALANTIGGGEMEDDELGANAILRKYKIGASPYPRGNQLLGLDALHEAAKNIGGPAAAAAEATPPAQQLVPPPQPPTERSFGQKAGRLALTVGGGLGGAALGTMASPGLGTMVGGAAGAAAGSGLAETFDPSENPIREAAIEAGTSAVGMKVAKTLGNVLAPGPAKEGGKELAEVMASRGLRPPVPTQYFDSKTVELMGTVGKASFIGAGSLDDAMQLGVKATREAAAEYAVQVQKSLAVGAKMMDDVAVQASQQGLKVDIRGVDNALRALAAKSPDNPKLQELSRLVQGIPGKNIPFNVTAEEAITRQAAATAAGGRVKPILNGAQDIASRLRAAARETSSEGEARLLGLAQKQLDDAMEASLGRGTAGLNDAWKAGRSTYREGIQGKEIGDILNKAIVSGGEAGEISGKALMNQLKPRQLEALKTQLEPTQIANLQRLARALEAAEGKGSSTLTFVSNGIQISGILKGVQGLATLGAAGGVAAGSAATGGGAALIALTPAALAKILASESTMKLMLALTRLPAGTKAAATATTLLTAQLARERILTPDEVPQPTQ